jgi:hypothetical protein
MCKRLKKLPCKIGKKVVQTVGGNVVFGCSFFLHLLFSRMGFSSIHSILYFREILFAKDTQRKISKLV